MNSYIVEGYLCIQYHIYVSFSFFFKLELVSVSGQRHRRRHLPNILTDYLQHLYRISESAYTPDNDENRVLYTKRIIIIFMNLNQVIVFIVIIHRFCLQQGMWLLKYKFEQEQTNILANQLTLD